jgi:ATP-binding cassette subfamily F protein 3
MSAEDIAEEIRAALPGTEEIIVQYLSGYLVDDAGEDEDVLNIAHEILQSVAGEKKKQLESLMAKLNEMLEEQLTARQKKKAQPKLQKLDKIMDMGKNQVSNTLMFSEGVDLESINKGKYVE